MAPRMNDARSHRSSPLRSQTPLVRQEDGDQQVRDTFAVPMLVVPKDVCIHGLIEGSMAVQVIGEVLGSIRAEGSVCVEAGARVGGDIHGSSVTVRGVVMGNIRAAAEAILDAGSVTHGDVCAVRIQVNREARVHGAVEEPLHTEMKRRRSQIPKPSQASTPGRESSQEGSERAPLRMLLPRRAKGSLRADTSRESGSRQIPLPQPIWNESSSRERDSE